MTFYEMELMCKIVTFIL